jgi:hypothetical protein
MVGATAEYLFNGKDLDGWEQTGAGGFTVEDGLLTTHGGMGLLWYTRRTVGDAVLRVVYRVRRAEDNSGVFIRIDGPPPDAWHAVHHGHEVQILATGDDWHATGCIYSMTAVTARADKPPGEWNDMDIVMQGDSVAVYVNGVGVTVFVTGQDVPPRVHDYEPERGPRPAHGYIGLQNHDDASVVQFREVSVRPLVVVAGAARTPTHSP